MDGMNTRYLTSNGPLVDLDSDQLHVGLHKLRLRHAHCEVDWESIAFVVATNTKKLFTH